ncbi:TKL family protein kinase [Histomonas meleagridis]|uniref:TKL family protein kinase n=1 Tax=Histomonas meleagridis TaxID=135588 RepID=UPI003559CD5D|nr:TKL family protein kinase [Histomonas meleagridis]KAH0799136.1 TKL family protein kinase [Histomonas meleagridis]
MKYNSNSLQEHCKFIQILSRNDIPFLIPFVGFTARQPYMVMLKCVADKSLHQILHGKKQNNITGDQKNSIATCVAYAISNLHQNNIVYNDIDSHNIIFDDNNIAYLYEFESSIQLDIDPQLSPPLISNNPAYIAPEVFKSNTYTTKSDVYSFGVLLWELETESIPYEGIAREQISEALKKEERLPIPQTAPPSLKKLIKKCWEQNPEKRPDFNKILEMFLTMQVSFNNSKVETIDSINKTYNSWKNNIPKIGFDNVIDLFRSLDTQKILSYTKIIDYDMSKPFIESVI